jgi:hypothetical protein
MVQPLGRKAKKIQPGDVSQETRESTYEGGPDTEEYPGYLPQRSYGPVMYEKPGFSDVRRGEMAHLGHVPGDGTVEPNKWRGGYGHGVIIDSDAHQAEWSRNRSDDYVDQVMPEHDDQDLREPVKVEVVNRNPDFIVVMNINTFHISSQALSGGGQPAQSGLTPVRILPKDPHRTRAVIGLSNVVGGSVPMMLTSEQSLPAYGFPIPVATTQVFVLYTTEEVWVSGSLATDDFVVAVMIERNINSDRLKKS